MKGRYLKVLIKDYKCYIGRIAHYEVGDYIKIVNIYETTFGDNKLSQIYKDYIGTHFELMPEGFTPIKEIKELPTHWYFKVTDENYKKFKDIRSLSSVYGYISSDPVFNLSWGSIYSLPPSNYIEISFEAFEKHVLNKEFKSIKTEEPVKEEWVGAFKVGDWVELKCAGEGNGVNCNSYSTIIQLLEKNINKNPTGHLFNTADFMVEYENRFYCTRKSSIIRKALPHEIPYKTGIDPFIPEYWKIERNVDNYKIINDWADKYYGEKNLFVNDYGFVYCQGKSPSANNEKPKDHYQEVDFQFFQKHILKINKSRTDIPKINWSDRVYQWPAFNPLINKSINNKLPVNNW